MTAFGRFPLKKTVENFFAIAAPGLEGVCAGELAELDMSGVRAVHGGAEFAGDLRDLYRANLWLRTATRVVVRIGEFRCSDFPELFRRAVRLPWGRFVKPGTAVKVRATTHHSRLTHTGRIAETLSEAIVRALGHPAAAQGPELLVLVRVENDLCQISVDSSGDLLHRRGYRLEAGPAPLRETLAAGVLKILGWGAATPLFDPMCGSGTFLTEGALLALKRPPGAGRDFAFMGWPGWRPGLWQAILHEASQCSRGQAVPIRGSDKDPNVLDVCRKNAQRAGIQDCLALQVRDLADICPAAEAGLLICNPPYGGRLSDGVDLRPLFRTLGEVCRRFSGWQVAFLSPDERLAQATGLPVKAAAHLLNGGIPVALMTARI